MITIPEVVGQIVRRSPYLEEALSQGIVNLSALARLIKPDVEKEVMKDVQDGAVIVALNRLSRQISKRTKRPKNVFRKAPDLIVRSNLFELTFVNSEGLVMKQKKLLDRMAGARNLFIAFTQGTKETTLIASRELESRIQAIFKGEKLISRIGRLSTITILLPVGTALIPGVYSYFLKALAWEGINVVEVVSTLNEFTIVLEDKVIDHAFSIIKRLF